MKTTEVTGPKFKEKYGFKQLKRTELLIHINAFSFMHLFYVMVS